MTKKFCTYVVMSTETDEVLLVGFSKTKGSVYSWIKDYNTNNFLITLDDSDDIP